MGALCTLLPQVVEIVDVRLADSAARVTKGSNKGQLIDDLKEEECWLELKVKRERCVNICRGGCWCLEQAKVINS